MSAPETSTCRELSTGCEPCSFHNAWLPAALPMDQIFPQEGRSSSSLTSGIRLVTVTNSLQGAERVVTHLRQARAQVLSQRPLASVVDSLDRLVQRWKDPRLPERRQWLELAVHRQGLSPELAVYLLERQLRALSGRKLESAVRAALKSPAMLDDFVSDPGLGLSTMAQGPELVGVLLKGLEPALPLFTLLGPLLMKSACLTWVETASRFGLPLLLETLEALDPELASCVALLPLPPTGAHLLEQLSSGVDHLIGFGSLQDELTVTRHLAGRVPVTWHRPGPALAIVLRSALGSPQQLEELVQYLACDFRTLEPALGQVNARVLLVEEGGVISPQQVAEALSAQWEHWCERFPPRPAALVTRGRLRASLLLLEFEQALGGQRRLISPRDRLQGIITLEQGNRPRVSEVEPTSEAEIIRVVSVPRWSEIPALLLSYGAPLRQVALAGQGFVADKLRHLLSRLGCVHLTIPGQLAEATLLSRDQGMPALLTLLRWCDQALNPVEQELEELTLDETMEIQLELTLEEPLEQGASAQLRESAPKTGPEEGTAHSGAFGAGPERPWEGDSDGIGAALLTPEDSRELPDLSPYLAEVLESPAAGPDRPTATLAGPLLPSADPPEPSRLRFHPEPPVASLDAPLELSPIRVARQKNRPDPPSDPRATPLDLEVRVVHVELERPESALLPDGRPSLTAASPG